MPDLKLKRMDGILWVIGSDGLKVREATDIEITLCELLLLERMGVKEEAGQ